ncbi:uncharacterized protein [Equus asinus]|uniref:uncharacterized protein n=1 Tax=Equus asinus TaxID=9793 RepID=UPI0038F5DF4F
MTGIPTPASGLGVSIPPAPEKQQRRAAEPRRPRRLEGAPPTPPPPRPESSAEAFSPKGKGCLSPPSNAPASALTPALPDAEGAEAQPPGPGRQACFTSGVQQSRFRFNAYLASASGGHHSALPAPGYHRNAPASSSSSPQLLLDPPHSSKAAAAATAAGAAETKRRRRRRRSVGPRLRQERWRGLPLPRPVVHRLPPPRRRRLLAAKTHLRWGPVAKAVYVV